jgi:hypothetical protein
MLNNKTISFIKGFDFSSVDSTSFKTLARQGFFITIQIEFK